MRLPAVVFCFVVFIAKLAEGAFSFSSLSLEEQIANSWLSNDPFAFCERFKSWCNSNGRQQTYTHFENNLKSEIYLLIDNYRNKNIFLRHWPPNELPELFMAYSSFSWTIHLFSSKYVQSINNIFANEAFLQPNSLPMQFEIHFKEFFGRTFHEAINFANIKKVQNSAVTPTPPLELQKFDVRRRNVLLKASPWRLNHLVPRQNFPGDNAINDNGHGIPYFYYWGFTDWSNTPLPPRIQGITNSAANAHSSLLSSVYQCLLNLPEVVKRVQSLQASGVRNPYVFYLHQYIYQKSIATDSSPIPRSDAFDTYVLQQIGNTLRINPMSIFDFIVRQISSIATHPLHVNFQAPHAPGSSSEEPLDLFNISSQYRCCPNCRCRDPKAFEIGFPLLEVIENAQQFPEIEIRINMSDQALQHMFPFYCDFVLMDRFQHKNPDPKYVLPLYLLFKTDLLDKFHSPPANYSFLSFPLENLIVSFAGVSNRYFFSHAVCYSHNPATNQFVFYNIIRLNSKLIFISGSTIRTVDITPSSTIRDEIVTKEVLFVIYEKID